jgi:hypothetical protein
MSPEQLTAVAAVVVAATALSVSVWQAAITRRHNRLSVRPALFFLWYDSPDRIGLYLRNVGLGPAQIHSLDLSLVDGNGEEEDVPDMFKACRELSLTDLGTVWAYDGRDNNDQWMAPQAEYPVVTFLLRFDEEEKRRENVRALQRLRLRLRYTSIYGEQSTLLYRVRSANFPVHNDG